MVVSGAWPHGLVAYHSFCDIDKHHGVTTFVRASWLRAHHLRVSHFEVVRGHISALEFLTSEVYRITFQLLCEERLLPDSILNDGLFLVTVCNEILHGNLWEAKNLGEICILLICVFSDVLLLYLL